MDDLQPHPQVSIPFVSVFARLTAALLLCLLLLPVHAQDAEPTAAAPVLSDAEIASLLTDIGAARGGLQERLEDIDSSEAEAWLEESPLDRLNNRLEGELSEAEQELWQQAQENELNALELVRGAVNRVQQARNGGARLDETVVMLEEMRAALGVEQLLPPAANLGEIEEALNGLTSRRSQALIELNQLRETRDRLQDDFDALPARMEELRRAREQELADLSEQDLGGELEEAREAALNTLRRRLDARVIATQLDSQSMLARLQVLPLEIRAHELQQIWLARQVERLQTGFTELSSQELRAISRRLRNLLASNPRLIEAQEERVELLRGNLAAIDTAQERIAELQAAQAEYARVEEDLSFTLESVLARMEVSGLTETLGSLYLEEQRRLQVHVNKEVELQALLQELSQTRLRIISLRDQARAVAADSEADASDLVALETLQAETREILLQVEQGLADQLRQTEVQLRAVVALVDELEQVLRETLIWWPSHRPLNQDWLMSIPVAVQALLNPTAWTDVGAAFQRITIESPLSFLAILSLVGMVIALSRSSRGRLARLAERTQHRFTDNIGHTVQAIGWSLLVALPVPLLLIALAYRLNLTVDSTAGVEIIATMLASAGLWWLVGHLVLTFIGRNGVGTVHFKWNPELLNRLRRNLAWYLPLQFCLILLLALSFAHPDDLVLDVVGRLTLVVTGLIAALLSWRLLAGFDRAAERPLLPRGRKIILVVLLAFAGASMVLALSGYLLTVSELLMRGISTLAVIGLVWLGHRLAVRSVALSESRLRAARLREERAKLAAMETNTPAGEAPPDIPDPHLSIEDINTQTRTLLRVAVAGVMVLALFWVWADILPALTWLDDRQLWTREISLPDGVVAQEIVSYQDVLLALFLAFLFIRAARNLPGLIEIILTRATQMDAAGRYSVSTLSRYLVFIVTIVSVFSLLGLRWGELQWLVAALTLGLGFGLQEVVANFVSGLIMLFERPVRVGDTITIGEYSGTVAKIRTRATTLIDWDNREVVVPNKNFITERLINWTLTDTVTRIIIPVGVSYDADPDLVTETLQKIAEEHSLVLQEPPPLVLFLQFGDSTLNFELRVFVSQLRERLEATSSLHHAIIREFRRCGIEIAYPQMDLHVRHMPDLNQEDLPTRQDPLIVKST